MAILKNKPAAWANYRRTLPMGFAVISDKEALAKPQILTSAREFINRQVKANAPLGTSETKRVGNDVVHFIVEPHYHAPGGAAKPYGWHKGCTVFIQKGGSLGLTPQQIAAGAALMPAMMAGETDFGAATEFGAVAKHGKQIGAFADGTARYAAAPVDLVSTMETLRRRSGDNNVRALLATRNRNQAMRDAGIRGEHCIKG